jgi:hypothetical protein
LFSKGLAGRERGFPQQDARNITYRGKALMPEKRAPLDDPRGSDPRRSVTPASADGGENPGVTASVDQFLQALPAIIHELSEASTAASAYLTGSRRMFERGARFDRMQSAIERAHLQAGRVNDAVRRLRESFSKLGRP